jgi:hypothetical protein
VDVGTNEAVATKLLRVTEPMYEEGYGPLAQEKKRYRKSSIERVQ